MDDDQGRRLAEHRKARDARTAITAEWLKTRLAGKPAPMKTVLADGAGLGYDSESIFNAFAWLGGIRLDHGWTWTLRKATAPAPAIAHVATAATPSAPAAPQATQRQAYVPPGLDTAAVYASRAGQSPALQTTPVMQAAPVASTDGAAAVYQRRAAEVTASRQQSSNADRTAATDHAARPASAVDVYAARANAVAGVTGRPAPRPGGSGGTVIVGPSDRGMPSR